MSGSIDYAFSTYGWAYRTGRQDRKHNQIIRTHRTTEDNKNAASTLLIEFELREAQIWTKKDLQVTDVYQEELALVVGELLPAEYCDPTGKDMQSAKYPRAFDPNVHDSVDPAPTTGIVVKQINHGGCSLFLVHGREGGLYRKSWLPSEALARVVYYREWTEKTSRTQEKQRSTDFKAGICKYSKEYIEKHQDNFLDPLQSSALKGQPDALLLVPPRQMVISYARQAVALWKEQGETGHLAQVYDVIMSSLGRINWEELEETDDEDHSKLIRVMIEGNDEFDMQEAIEAFQACQALWPVPPNCTSNILPEALCQLAQGLRAGSLSGTPIHESRYRTFVNAFCADYAEGRTQGDQALSKAIQRAYHLALVLMYQPRDA